MCVNESRLFTQNYCLDFLGLNNICVENVLVNKLQDGYEMGRF